MMNKANNLRDKILNQPSYWVEGINSELYNAVLDYMEQKDVNRTQLAKHLGVSKGRISQILNDGEINFSIEKLIEIALKIDKFPIFKLEDKFAMNSAQRIIQYDMSKEGFDTIPEEKDQPARVIPIRPGFSSHTTTIYQ